MPDYLHEIFFLHLLIKEYKLKRKLLTRMTVSIIKKPLNINKLVIKQDAFSFRN